MACLTRADSRNHQSGWRKSIDEIGQTGKRHLNPFAHDLDGLEGELRDATSSISSNSRESLTPSLFAERLQEFYSLAKTVSKQNRVLRKLYLKSLQAREDDIQNPAADTFQWLLGSPDPPSPRKLVSTMPALRSRTPEQVRQAQLSRNFLNFLRQRNQTLFISGRAGCGKSTLMKFLSGNKRVMEALKEWAGDRKLVVVKMFFWRSDDLFLKSLRGFYSAILFHTIRHCPELVDKLFPPEESEAEGFMDAAEYPTEELRKSVSRLTNLRISDTHCFCYFIDGLDEYEGDAVDHSQLAKQLTDWSAASEAKIICSGRPSAIYRDAFESIGMTIDLHELTAPDIRRFARHKFNVHLDKPEHLEAKKACLKLVNVIVERAEGVFLWAGLVVRALLNASILNENPSRLEHILEECPSDLNQFFKKILQRIHPDRWAQRRSMVLLYLTLRNPYSRALNGLVPSWLDELDWLADSTFQDNHFPLDIDARGYSEDEIKDRLKTAKDLLQAHTQGIVELREVDDEMSPLYFKHRLEFFHRSVREFLEDEWLPEVQQNLKPLLLPHQEVEIYSRILCAEAKFCPQYQDPTNTSENLRDFFETSFFWFLRLTTKQGIHPPRSCLQDLEQIVNGGSLQIESGDPGRTSIGMKGTVKAFLGYLKIEHDRSWRWHDRTDDGCSFLHLAAYFAQHDYILDRLGGIERDIRDAEGLGLNLLLSTSVGTDVVLCRHLLNHGWSHGDQVRIDHEMAIYSPSTMPTTSVWLIVLRDFAHNAVAFLHSRRQKASCPEYLDRDWIERFAAVIEAFLCAGASPRMQFILSFDDGPYYTAPLELLLEGLKPPNWPALCGLLHANQGVGDLGTKKREPHADGFLGYSRLMALGKECSLSMLLRNYCHVLAVEELDSGNSLDGSFKVRVF